MATSGGHSSARRGVRARDWIAVAVVAALAAGLGIYLLAKPGGDSAAPPMAPTAASDASPASAVSGARPSRSEASGATSGAGATSGGSPTAAGAAETPSAPTPDPAETAPPVETSAQKAGPIGPIGDLSRRVEGDPLALGRVDAPVVMVEFADYRCPFCAKFSRDLKPELVKKYVDTGIVRIEWRDFPIFGPESERAAVAGRAAAAQGKFWEFNAAVYAAAPDTGHPDLTDTDLVDFATQAGVPDIAKFRADLDDPALKAAVDKDAAQGATLGVPSTPAFVVNGYPLLGAQPIDEFNRLIDTVRSLQ